MQREQFTTDFCCNLLPIPALPGWEKQLPISKSATRHWRAQLKLAGLWLPSSGVRTHSHVRQSSSHSNPGDTPVSYTHLRAHETRHDLVCRLLLEKKKKKKKN